MDTRNTHRTITDQDVRAAGSPRRLSLHKETIRALETRARDTLANMVTGIKCPSGLFDTECCHG